MVQGAGLSVDNFYWQVLRVQGRDMVLLPELRAL